MSDTEHPQADMQKSTSARRSPPRKERIYPTLHRHINPNLKPQAMRVHPKGFKILSKASPLERGMSTYFRMPPKAPPRVVEEHAKLKKTVTKIINKEEKRGVVLDGYALMEASGATQPPDAIRCVINDSHLISAVSEDLYFFTNLEFLDLGENCISLQDLAPLPAVEELHLHCNLVKSLEMPIGAMPKLHTLNLSFNQVDAKQLEGLSELKSLECLDLSCNGLKQLPQCLSALKTLRALALENNRLSTGDALLALGTLPELQELNLNFNQFTACPQIPQNGFVDPVLLEELDNAQKEENGEGEKKEEETQDPSIEQQQQDGGDHNNSRTPPTNQEQATRPFFPKLDVLGLAANQIVYFEDVYNLTQLNRLKRVIMWGNPIEGRQQDSEILHYEFNAVGIQVVLESPVPPKRKTGDFYKKETCPFRKVVPVDGSGLSLAQQKKQRKKQQVPTTSEQPTLSQQQSPTGEEPTDSFFVTQVQESGGLQHQSSTSATATSEHHQQQNTNVSQQHQVHESPWFSQDNVGLRGVTGTRSGNNSRPNTRGSASRDLPPPRGGAQQPPGPLGFTTSSHAASAGRTTAQQQNQYSLSRTEADMCRVDGNVRSVMTELRRMLRQPLPPIAVPRSVGSGGTQQQTRQQ